MRSSEVKGTDELRFKPTVEWAQHQKSYINRLGTWEFCRHKNTQMAKCLCIRTQKSRKVEASEKRKDRTYVWLGKGERYEPRLARCGREGIRLEAYQCLWIPRCPLIFTVSTTYIIVLQQ